MLDFIRKYIRRRREKELGCARSGRFVPIGKAKSAAVILDAQASEYGQVRGQVMETFGRYGIQVHEINVLAETKKAEASGSYGGITIFRDDISRAGIPVREIMDRCIALRCDYIVNTFPNGSWPAEFIVKCSRAGFRAGFGDSGDEDLDLSIVCRNAQAGPENVAFLLDSIQRMSGKPADER